MAWHYFYNPRCSHLEIGPSAILNSHPFPLSLKNAPGEGKLNCQINFTFYFYTVLSPNSHSNHPQTKTACYHTIIRTAFTYKGDIYMFHKKYFIIALLSNSVYANTSEITIENL